MPETVSSGAMVAVPTTPTKLSLTSKIDPFGNPYAYTFKGWFLPNGAIFDFNTQITRPITLTAKWVLNGDVNNDGEVDDDDWLYLARYLFEWPAYANIPVYEAADVNGDDVIDDDDWLYLARHLFGWQAYAKLGPA